MDPRAQVVVQPLDAALMAPVSRILHKLKHDLSNSLVASMGELELLAADLNDADAVERLEEARSKLLRPFLDLRRMASAMPLPETSPPRWQDLRTQLETRAQSLGVTLQLTPEASAALADDAALRPLLSALVANALDAAQAGVTVDVALGADLATGTHRLDVVDDGPGCADLAGAASGRVTRAGGVHLGLGLAVAARLLANRGGVLTLADNLPHGMRARASWPAR